MRSKSQTHLESFLLLPVSITNRNIQGNERLNQLVMVITEIKGAQWFNHLSAVLLIQTHFLGIFRLVKDLLFFISTHLPIHHLLTETLSGHHNTSRLNERSIPHFGSWSAPNDTITGTASLSLSPFFNTCGIMSLFVLIGMVSYYWRVSNRLVLCDCRCIMKYWAIIRLLLAYHQEGFIDKGKEYL